MSTVTFHGQIREERFRRRALESGGSLISHVLRAAARPFTLDREAGSSRALGERLRQETREARELASRYAESDPGFAEDLRAAVMRHEAAALPIRPGVAK